MIVSAIAAMAKNRVIGKDNRLPWDLPEDMKFFREKTKGKVLIMGRKTFESLPSLLPGRFHIVVTRNLQYFPEESKAGLDKVQIVPDLETALQVAAQKIPQYPEEVMVLGGGEIYQQSLPYLDKIYLTVIEKDFDGDAHFPMLDPNDFERVEKIDRQQPIPFSFQTFIAKK